MLKRLTIVLSSYTSLYNSAPALSTSSRTTLRRRPLTRPQCDQLRAYAIVANGGSRHQHENIPWPEVASADAIPTPYQIFNQKEGTPYSKRIFYELVKMYHPDRHNIHGTSGDLSYATKLDRYRLVIAANDVLSDPIKKGAYDRYGAGWNGFPGVKSPQDASETAGGWDTYSGRGWGRGPGGPFRNATWEDWERWYERDEKPKQQPTYVSNGMFVALVISFAILGGIGQATWVEKQAMGIQEQKNALHHGISKDLVHRRRESAASGDPKERIYNFLRLRDHYGYHLVDLQEEQYRKLLVERGACSSANIKARSTVVYRRENGPEI